LGVCNQTLRTLVCVCVVECAVVAMCCWVVLSSHLNSYRGSYHSKRWKVAVTEIDQNQTADCRWLVVSNHIEQSCQGLGHCPFSALRRQCYAPDVSRRVVTDRDGPSGFSSPMANKTSTTPTNGQSLGFEQQLNIRPMFVVHKTFNIDFGLYVGDCEAAATDK
jgi:hypothetical protein